ncbi:hypothetical protein J2W21_003401 [Sinomonas atrocyanea]|uniref:hypothetical protein n=1 Tax=Sinomonas atrocyanea TaxID=37927 RepID=UPI0027818B11|nr:hypothetical protein [Sinomonas atrocyanea]MDP9885876.1 hypothetical protein [Sinomonas atrocyanea]
MCAIQGAMPLIVVDDDGEFHLYRTEAELLRSDERPGTSRCVIDRSGLYRHLLAGPDGLLAVSRSLGPADHYSLRQQFLRQQHAHPEAHRLLRRYPSTREDVLSAIFEELELEDPADRQEWTLHAGPTTTRCAGLHAVDAQTAHRAGVVVVADPFGHLYVPHAPTNRGLARRLRGNPLYVEIGPQDRPQGSAVTGQHIDSAAAGASQPAFLR